MRGDCQCFGRPPDRSGQVKLDLPGRDRLRRGPQRLKSPHRVGPKARALSTAADHLADLARDLGLSDDAVLAVVRNALARLTPQRA